MAGDGGAVPEHRTAAGELVVKAFGPLAEALGQELARLPPFAARNLARLADAFQRKRHAQESSEPSSRLFKRIIDEASWADDEVIAEYLGGVLAASGTTIANDRGVAITNQIQRMSALQLKSHYILYAEVLRIADRSADLDLGKSRVRAALHVDIRIDEFAEALGLGECSRDEVTEVLGHVFAGLRRDGLIARGDFLNTAGESESDRAGLMSFHPSVEGAELFLWGAGSKITNGRKFFDVDDQDMWGDFYQPLPSSVIESKAEEVYALEVDMLQSLLLKWNISALLNGAEEFVGSYPDAAPGYFLQVDLQAPSRRPERSP